MIKPAFREQILERTIVSGSGPEVSKFGPAALFFCILKCLASSLCETHVWIRNGYCNITSRIPKVRTRRVVSGKGFSSELDFARTCLQIARGRLRTVLEISKQATSVVRVTVRFWSGDFSEGPRYRRYVAKPPISGYDDNKKLGPEFVVLGNLQELPVRDVGPRIRWWKSPNTSQYGRRAMLNLWYVFQKNTPSIEFP